jgi:O-antigen ligase
MSYFKISKFFLIASIFSIVIVFKATLFPFIVGKYAWFRIAIDLAFIFFLLGILIQDKGSVALDRFLALFRRPLVIAVSAFAAVFLLACLFGVDPSLSFWSNFERGEGGLQIIHLYLFFMLALFLFREKSDWFAFFVWMMVVGLLSVLYGTFAGAGNADFIGPEFGSSGFRFFGTIGNPAYLAAYMIFLIFFGGYLLAVKYRNQLFSLGSLAVMGLMIIFIVSFWGAATRGAFLGLIASLVAFAAYLTFSKKSLRKWLVLGIVVLAIIVSCFVYFKDTAFVKAIPGSRVFDISFTTETFRHRAIMWGAAVEGWKDRPILGWGPENYIYVFSEHFGLKYFEPAKGFGAWFDRAHSIYFDYLVEIGALGLLSFLSIFIVFYWKTIRLLFKKAEPGEKSRSAIAGALLFAVPVAYLVQGMALFDVLPIYISVFSVIAFASHELEEKEPDKNKELK